MSCVDRSWSDFLVGKKNWIIRRIAGGLFFIGGLGTSTRVHLTGHVIDQGDT